MTNLIVAAAQPAGDGSAQINQWLKGLIEIAKICVIFAGGYFSHWLLLRRDVANRRHAFLAFLNEFRSELSIAELRQDWVSRFFNKIPELTRSASQVYGDLTTTKADALRLLVSTLSGLTKEGVGTKKEQVYDLFNKIEAILHDA
jgi:hypothetical protein